MSEVREVEERVAVPRNTGIAGFLRVIESVLRLSRVQSILIDGRGSVTYRRLAREDERASLGLDFSALQPNHVIKHGELSEVSYDGRPHSSLFRALQQAAQEHLEVVAWAVGSVDSLRAWSAPSGVVVIADKLLGWPLVADPDLGADMLVLCCAYQKTAALIDCHRFYRVDMGEVRTSATSRINALPEVDIL